MDFLKSDLSSKHNRRSAGDVEDTTHAYQRARELVAQQSLAVGIPVNIIGSTYTLCTVWAQNQIRDWTDHIETIPRPALISCGGKQM